MNFISSRTWVKVGFVGIFAVLAKVFEVDNTLLPLIILCAGDSGGSGGSGDSNGDTSGAMGSTPFLCTWNGTSFKFENDVLFGKPTSIFPTREAGKARYEEGSVTGDLYKISNTVVARNGRIPFQIKEIEPEESYIDHLSLLRITHPVETEVIVSSDFTNHLVFKKEALLTQEGVSTTVIKTHAGDDVSTKLSHFAGEVHPHEMQTGDSITLQVKVEKTERPLFFIMGSQYRDWTIGDIPTLTRRESVSFLQNRIREILAEKRSFGSLVTGGVKIIIFSLMLGTAWTLSGIHTLVARPENNSNDVSKLVLTYGVQKAHADVPARSLVVECLVNDAYERIDVIQPRYHQRTLESIRVPQGAIKNTGEVTLRVTATKRHNVTNAFFVAPEELLPSEASTLQVCSARKQGTGEDFAEVLNDKYSGEYMHTVPADVVDIEFGPILENTDDPKMKHTYVINAHGFYTPLSEDTKVKVGDWTSRLDTDARTVLEDLYSLNGSSTEDRKIVI